MLRVFLRFSGLTLIRGEKKGRGNPKISKLRETLSVLSTVLIYYSTGLTNT